jgi:lipoprotein signal peptidase
MFDLFSTVICIIIIFFKDFAEACVYFAEAIKILTEALGNLSDLVLDWLDWFYPRD